MSFEAHLVISLIIFSIGFQITNSALEAFTWTFGWVLGGVIWFLFIKKETK